MGKKLTLISRKESHGCANQHLSSSISKGDPLIPLNESLKEDVSKRKKSLILGKPLIP